MLWTADVMGCNCRILYEPKRNYRGVFGQSAVGKRLPFQGSVRQFLSTESHIFPPFLQGGTAGPQALTLPTSLLSSPQQPIKPTSVSLSWNTSTAKPHPPYLHDEKVTDYSHKVIKRK